MRKLTVAAVVLGALVVPAVAGPAGPPAVALQSARTDVAGTKYVWWHASGVNRWGGAWHAGRTGWGGAWRGGYARGYVHGWANAGYVHGWGYAHPVPVAGWYHPAGGFLAGAAIGGVTGAAVASSVAAAAPPYPITVNNYYYN